MRLRRVGGAGGAIDEISSALHSMGTARGPGGASTPMPPPLGSMGGSAQSGPGQPPQKDIKVWNECEEGFQGGSRKFW